MPSDEFKMEVAGEMFKMSLTDGGLISNLRDGKDKVMRSAQITANRMAPEVENYMKTNAPWQDQTGNARNGLAARPFQEGDNVGIVLYHQVDYGIWLEARWSGKYAIIQPTIDEMGPRVMRAYERTLDRI